MEVSSFSIYSQLQMVSPVFLYYLLSESPSESFILSLYLWYLRILMVSINYSYSLYAEKETIEYWLPFRLFGTMASSNSIRVRKCRGHIRATQGWVFLLISFNGIWPISVTPLFRKDFAKFLDRIGLIFGLLGCISPFLDESDASDT